MVRSGDHHPPPGPLVLAVIGVAALAFLLPNLTFGLPGVYSFNGYVVPTWFPDEAKEVAHIQSLLTPRTTLLPYNYPPLQYLLVSLVLLPARLGRGIMPPEWVLALSSRLVSAAAVAATAVVICVIGGRISRRGGVLAAVLFAASPIAANLGRDAKPIALAGLFLALAIWAGGRVLERGPSSRRLGLVGALLGASVACSHLSIAYLHLPVLCVLLWNRREHGTYFPRMALEEEDARRPTLAFATTALLLAGSCAALYAVACHKPWVLGLGERLWAMQPHGRPYAAHLPQIEAYYRRLPAVLGASSSLLGCAVVYVLMRARLLRTRPFADLRTYEAAYGALAATVAGTLLLATALNPLTPLSIMRFVDAAAAYAGGKGGYYGLYPGPLEAPSFLFGILPQSFGVPLLVAGGAGLGGLLLRLRAPGRLEVYLVAAFLPFTVQILTWNTMFRASRFAYSLSLVVCLCAGTWLARLTAGRTRAARAAGAALAVFILAYTTAFASSFILSRGYEHDGRVLAARWVTSNVPAGAAVAVRTAAELPRLPGPLDGLPGYRYVLFEDGPDIAVVDGFEQLAMAQYFAMTASGYRFVPSDWSPSPNPPGPVQIAALHRILNSGEYALVCHTSSNPAQIGTWRFATNLLLDPTEYMHHDVYVYRRRQSQ